ncbi:MAG: phytanoyl-CoA dioxygenase family protein, partial [Gammaproteobacteria bacterium]|nr:phytanoyl-CoA dioxygenase family protein [Gammaproteobacteria bacterium]
ISLHDVYLMHGSEANTSDRPRRGMTLRYMPTTSVYRRDLGKSPIDDKRTLFLMRGEDASGQNDFRVR